MHDFLRNVANVEYVCVCVCVCVCVYTLYNGSNTSKTRMLNMKSNLYYGMGEIKLNCKTHTIV